MFYNARWYDPSLGRFAQADSIVPDGVQGLDRYAYVNNSPMNYVDPSGHESVCGQANSDPECGDLGHSELSHPKPQKPGNEEDTPQIIPRPHCDLCDYPPESAGEPDDFVAPWDLSRVDGAGYRFDYSYWYYVVGVDFTADIIYNFNSSEVSLLFSGSLMGGAGLGGDASPLNVVLVYDAPNNDALTGGSGVVAANLTTGLGIQGSYSESLSKNGSGEAAKIYSIGVATGAKASAGAGFGFTPWNLKLLK